MYRSRVLLPVKCHLAFFKKARLTVALNTECTVRWASLKNSTHWIFKLGTDFRFSAPWNHKVGHTRRCQPNTPHSFSSCLNRLTPGRREKQQVRSAQSQISRLGLRDGGNRYVSLTVSRHVSFEGCLKGNVFVAPGGVQAFENLNQTFVSLGGCWGGFLGVLSCT